MHSFLRWAGSKRKLLPVLSQYWSGDYKRYVEPFVGSAALFFHLNPSKAVLADINEELISMYRSLRARPNVIWNEFSRIPATEREFYKIRKLDTSQMSSDEKTARFIFLNRLCFNGIYRTNLNGDFNVPFGGARAGAMPSLTHIKSAAQALRNAKLVNADFESVVRENVRAGDFVYLDPPFARRQKRVFREYHPDSFSVEDLERLSTCLELINKRGASFLLSYADCPEARRHFKKWPLSRQFVQRNVSGFAKNRRIDRELLFSNIK